MCGGVGGPKAGGGGPTSICMHPALVLQATAACQRHGCSTRLSHDCPLCCPQAPGLGWPPHLGDSRGGVVIVGPPLVVMQLLPLRLRRRRAAGRACRAKRQVRGTASMSVARRVGDNSGGQLFARAACRGRLQLQCVAMRGYSTQQQQGVAHRSRARRQSRQARRSRAPLPRTGLQRRSQARRRRALQEAQGGRWARRLGTLLFCACQDAQLHRTAEQSSRSR